MCIANCVQNVHWKLINTWFYFYPLRKVYNNSNLRVFYMVVKRSSGVLQCLQLLDNHFSPYPLYTTFWLQCCICSMTKISATLILVQVNSGTKLLRYEMAWCRLTWHLVAPLRCATVPTQQDRLAFVLWVSTFPPENRQYLLWLWGHVWMEAAVGKPQEMEMGRKEWWCWCTLFFAIPLVMKCHNRVYTAVLLVWAYYTREPGLSFSVFSWPICRCDSLMWD